MNEHYANFMQWYGEVALKLSPRARRKFSRLFWFTIEFGLTQTQAGLRIYGGGILSSYAETIFSLESDEPARKALDVSKVLETPYDYQNIQTAYFFLPESEGLAALFELQTHPAVLAFLETQDAASVEQPPFVIC